MKKGVFGDWYNRGSFLWIPAIEYGLVFGGFALFVHVVGFLFFTLRGRDQDTLAGIRGEDRNRLWESVRMMSAAFMAGLTGGFLLLTMAAQVIWRLHDRPYAIVTAGPPLALLVFVASTFVEIWLLGRWESDDVREWWARVCAWLVIAAAAWLAFFGITLYGPMLINSQLHPYVQSGLGVGWIMTAAGGAFAGRRSETKPGGRGVLLKLLVQVAPPVFVIGLMIVVSMLVDSMVFEYFDDRMNKLGLLPASVDRSASWVYWNGVVSTPSLRIALALCVCLILSGLATVMSNVNLFSLNAMYAERLVRCYLGASRRKREWGRRGAVWRTGSGGAPTGNRGPMRRENSITGFDAADDIPLWRFKIGAEPLPRAARRVDPEYLGPHLIINTAINLVSGSELAWQDRKAESFMLTPTHCGSKGTGYAPTIPQTGAN